ncbi:MAG: MFS transporter [Alphaproteobacteria bacterium]
MGHSAATPEESRAASPGATERPDGTVLSVATAFFLLFIGMGVWVPYVPLYLATRGLSGSEIGLVLGLAPAARWTAAIPWAYAADRLRIRHALFLVATVASTACLVGLAFADRLPTILLAVAAVAAFGAPLVPMMDAMCADHLPRLGGNYGRLRAWGSLGFVVGSVLAAAVIARSSALVVPWLLVAAQLVLPFAALRLPREQHGHVEHFHAPWRLLSPPMNAFLATSLLFNLGAGAWAGFFAVHTRALGLPDWVPGVTWGLGVVTEVIALWVGRDLFARWGPAEVLVGVLLATAARYLVTSLVTGEAATIATQLAYGPCFALSHLAAQLVLARLVPSRSSTNGQALYGFVSFGVGGSTGLALAGLLVDRLGTASVFRIEAVVTLLAILPALRLRALLRHRPNTAWTGSPA